MINPMSLPALYTFIDEGGNFDFSLRGTRYLTITGVSVGDAIDPVSVQLVLDQRENTIR
jgi:hypothetical protein